MTSARLKRIYDSSPPSAQSVLLSAYHLKVDRERYGPRFRAAVDELARTEWASAEALREHQESAWARWSLMRRKTCRSFRIDLPSTVSTLEDFGGADDLERLPSLTRAHIDANFDDLVATNRRGGDLVMGHTSGTTGSPHEVPYDVPVTAMTYAMLA